MPQQQEEVLHTPDFGDQVTFTVGASYLLGFTTGMAKAMGRGLPKWRNMPQRLAVNNLFNAVGTETSKMANSFAGAGFLYFCIGKTLNIFFEDQLDYLSPLQTNMACGAITGAVFKSTLGVIPSAYGFVLGGLIAGSLSKLIELGNEKGYIGF